MKAFDFSYDGKNLGDFGFILCNFGGSKGLETVSDGCQITLNTVSVLGGSKHRLTSTEYEEIYHNSDITLWFLHCSSTGTNLNFRSTAQRR